MILNVLFFVSLLLVAIGAVYLVHKNEQGYLILTTAQIFSIIYAEATGNTALLYWGLLYLCLNLWGYKKWRNHKN